MRSSAASSSATQDLLLAGLGVVAWTDDPSSQTAQTQKTSQNVHGGAAYIPAGKTVTTLSTFVMTVGAGTTHGRVAVSDKVGAVLSQSADNTTYGQALGWQGLALSAPWVSPASDVYYLCVWIVATTMPFLLGNTLPAGTQAGRSQLPGGKFRWFVDGPYAAALPATLVLASSSAGQCVVAT